MTAITGLLDAAQAALGYKGNFANEPEAHLVILPNEMIDPKNRIGANLVYVVELLVEDGSEAMGRHFYYVDANDGHIVWNYNALTTINGNSLYSGQVTFPTRPVVDKFWIQDTTRGANGLADPNTTDATFDTATQEKLRQGGIWTVDVTQHCDHIGSDPLCDGSRKATAIHIGSIFMNDNDVWGDGLPYQHDANGLGNGTPANEQTAAVDAQFASMQHWDYFHNTYGRDGIDGHNYRMLTRVHWAQKYDFAFWNGRNAGFGDGSADPALPWTPIDIVAHEITHGLFEKALGIDADSDHPLIYTLETAAFNESFADIFGTAVEFYARERQCVPCPANLGTYRTCEQRRRLLLCPIRSVSGGHTTSGKRRDRRSEWLGRCAGNQQA